jgi:O-antigen/teichoic acid export membrane protein
MQTEHSKQQGGWIKYLLKDAFIYGASSAFTKVLSFITYPILARKLGAVEYGQLDYTQIIAGLLASLMIFGQDSAIGRYYYEYEKLKEKIEVISQSLAFQVLISILIASVVLLNKESIALFVMGSRGQDFLILMIAIQAPLLVIIFNCQHILRWTHNKNGYLILTLTYSMINTAVIIGIVFYSEISLRVILISSTIVLTIFSFVGLYLIRNWLVIPKSYNKLLIMLPLSASYGLITVLSNASPTLERYAINKFTDTATLGVYAAATKFALILGFLTYAFETAWGPFSMKIHKEKNAWEMYNFVLRIFFCLICAMPILISMGSYFIIPKLLGSEYVESVALVYFACTAIIIQALGWIIEVSITISKKAHYSIFVQLAYLVILFILIQNLTPKFGLFGVGVALTVTQFFRTSLISYICVRVHPNKWQYKRIFAALLLMMVSGGGLMVWCAHQSAWINFISMFTYSFALISTSWMYVLQPMDRAQIRIFLENKRL